MHRGLRLVAITGLGAVALGAASTGRSSSREAALELVEVMRVQQTATASADVLADTVIKANPILAPYRDVIIKWAHDTMTWEAIGPRIADIYQETFTDKEMREAAAFYRTPTGQKILDKLPEVMQKSVAVGAELGQAHQEELRKMIADRAKALSDLQKAP